MNKQWMLYGANGYTGQLIVEEAVRCGMKPTLAGRREEAVRSLAEAYGLPWRVFPLDAPATVVRHLDGCSAVLLAAGPFSMTSAVMVNACLQAHVHYLDITGEIDVFEACHARDSEARVRGCVVLPGVGFDVVPSDCLAASLAEALPSAVGLELAFAGGAGSSRGTTKTALETLGHGCAIRENGRIKRVSFGSLRRDVKFRDRERPCIAIPWGDVSTAYYSTGISNIVVYLAVSRMAHRITQLLRIASPLLRVGRVQVALKERVEKVMTGPNADARRAARMHVWGRVYRHDGVAVEGTLETPEGYALTAVTAVACVQRVCENSVAPGAITPSRAFGARFISSFPECSLELGTPA
jgi:short subunit dehydrogenase-like uncharacterized protein